MNLSPFVFVFLWLAAMAVLIGWSWWRKWHRQYAAARRTYRAAAEDVEAATVFYGSMQLDPALERHHVSGQNWRERTMVELAPEALDPGPGDAPLVDPGPAERLCGPEQPQEARTTADVGVAPAMKTGIGTPGPADLPDQTWRDEARSGMVVVVRNGVPRYEYPAGSRLADTGDITAAHATHPHPGDGWLDTQLADLYDWVRTQLEAA